MSDRHTFGPRLRSERERRGISLEHIAAVTKVSTELWDGLEHNDFSRWPSGIFARAFIRDYARAVGLDSDEVVNEFCRLFPLGDRRKSRLIKAQAQLIGHRATVEDDTLPVEGDRRAPAPPDENSPRARAIRLAPRGVAAAIDVTTAVTLSAGVSLLLGTSFWATAGVMGLLYYGTATVAFGHTPGTRATDALRHRLPALFSVPDSRRAHA
jgi:transcriptional regulator with XRE-family HTH domain